MSGGGIKTDGTELRDESRRINRAKSETWKQKRANMRASVCMRVRVRVRVCACACARPNGRAARRGPRRGWERTPQPCVRRRQSRNPRPRPRRRSHRGRHPPRGTPATSGGEHRRARRCSPSGGGGWKCRRLAPRHAMRPRTRATPSPPPRWRSREAARAHRWSTRGMRRTHMITCPPARGGTPV